MFGPAGRAYVYFTYGMHFCFNVVTERDGIPGAVLIRGLDGISHANGPARLCRTLGLGSGHNGLDLTAGAPLWIERGRPRRGERIVQTNRVGIRVAQDLPRRFYIAGSAGVSKRDRAAELQRSFFRYVAARWGGFSAVSNLLLAADIPAKDVEEWHEDTAKALVSNFTELELLSLHPQAVKYEKKKLLTSFEQWSGTWRPDVEIPGGEKTHLNQSSDWASHGTRSLMVSRVFPEEGGESGA